MVRSCGWNLALRRSSLVAILDQQLPFIAWVLKLVQIKCYQVVEEEALNLASEYEELRA